MSQTIRAVAVRYRVVEVLAPREAGNRARPFPLSDAAAPPSRRVHRRHLRALSRLDRCNGTKLLARLAFGLEWARGMRKDRLA